MSQCRLATVLGASMLAGAVHADINFMGPVDFSGAGYGSVLSLLNVQANSSEFGSVLRFGGADALGGDAKPQSQTRSVFELGAQGVTAENLGLVFNISEPGSAPEVTLDAFTLRFYTDNETSFFDLAWNGPLTLTQVGVGVGGAGYLFDVNLTDAQAAAFFSDPNNRIGMLVGNSSPITGSAGAPESFFLVPAPGTAAVLAMSALMGFRRRR